jgi:hypothetical protein
MSLPEPSRDRLNLSELARLLIASNARGSSDRATVRLTRNARGDTQIEVLVGAGDDGTESVTDVSARACEVYDALRERYPLGQAAPPDEGS